MAYHLPSAVASFYPLQSLRDECNLKEKVIKKLPAFLPAAFTFNFINLSPIYFLINLAVCIPSSDCTEMK